ncbi:MAG: PepSY domain-containing protein [Gemmataceae bacterium]
MRKVTICLCVAALAGVVAVAVAQADDKAEKIAPDKLPKAIKDAVMGRFPNAEITGAEKEKEDGKVMFDIELKHDGRKYEMDIAEDGTIIEIEKEVFSKDVPKAINDAVKGKYPNATIKEVMEVNKVKDRKETPAHYEITIEDGGKKMEVIVSLDGKSVKKEGEK